MPAYHGEQYQHMVENRSRSAEAFPHLARRDGTDHVFVVSASDIPSWPQLVPLRNAVQLTVESFQVNGDVPRWYSPWKDVIIPGYIDRYRIEAMRRSNRETHARDLTLAFHGGHAGTHENYRNCSIRTKILGLFSREADCSVGGPVRDYFDRMGRSHFCLVPRGLSAWTIHLYESFFLGCIPVILSDEFAMPFQEIVNWPSFSIKWPMDTVGSELL